MDMTNARDELESLFLRLAMAESKQLETLLPQHLRFVIDCAGQNDQSLRDKAMEILTHLNKRLKSNETIAVPVVNLLDSIANTQTPSVQIFSMVYVRMGLKRNSNSNRVSYIESILKTIGSNSVSATVKTELLGQFVSLLSELENDESIKQVSKHVSSILEDANTVDTVLQYARLVILMPNDDHYFGMSDVQFNSVKHLIKADLAKIKLSLLKFLSCSFIDQDKIGPIFMFAFADGFVRVTEAAESYWRTLYGFDFPFSNATYKLVYTTFLGTLKDDSIPRNLRCQPASVVQRTKLMPFLIRSTTALTMSPYNMQVIFDVLFGSRAKSAKLLSYIFDFVIKMVNACNDKWLQTLGPVLFDGVQKFISESNEQSGGLEMGKIVSQAYIALGELGKRCPAKTLKDQSLMAQMLEDLNSEKYSDIVSGSIADCVGMLLPVLKNAPHNDKSLITAVFTSHLQHGNPRARLTALKGLEAVCLSDDPHFLWLLVCASIDGGEDLRRECNRLLASLKEEKQLPPFDAFVLYCHNQKQTDLNIVAAGVQMCRNCVSAGDSEETSPIVVKYLGEVAENIAQAYHSLIITAFQNLPMIVPLELMLARSDICKLDLWKEQLPHIRNVMSRSTKCDEMQASSSVYCIVRHKLEGMTSLGDELVAEKHITDAVLWTTAHAIAQYKTNSQSEMEVDGANDKWVTLECRLCEGLQGIHSQSACGGLALSLSRGPLIGGDTKSLIDILANVVSSRKDTIKQTTKEYAAHALGLLSLGADQQTLITITKALMAVGEGPPQLDVQFAVGQALVDTVLQSHSPSRRNAYMETVHMHIARNAAESGSDKQCGQRLRDHLNLIINEKLIDPNRHLRQACIIWLFVAFDWCKKHPVMVENLAILQEAFIDGLAEANDFVQDICSQGLANVYECCDSSLRKQLVANLVDSLTAGRKVKAPVTGDTKLFSKGALGPTPTGDSLTTYQELCSLASHLNKPDLIYKFMQLAQHNALWNSKKGAAFGFETVFKQAEAELEPYLPAIIPKLYRYQYDPSTKVQLAMKSIWKTMTKSRKGVIDEFGDEIFKELMITITDKQWRVRESTCLALSDLLSSHCTDYLMSRFDELWDVVLRVFDDIKESVRIAAGRALTTLHKVTVKCSSSTSRSAIVFSKCLPILLNTGIKHSIPEIRAISLATVTSVMKESGSGFKEYMGIVVGPLLESLSELEPQTLSYMAARSSGDDLERLDSARANVAKEMPSMEALMRCTRFMDTQTLLSIVPTLCELLRTSVGLGTRTGTCTFIAQLCTVCPLIMRHNPQVAEKLVNSLSNSLADRNGIVRKQSASSIGSLVRFCSSNAIKKLLHKLIHMFLNPEADLVKQQCLGHVLKSMCMQDPEILKDHMTQLVPVVFLAVYMTKTKDESGKAQQQLWDEIWSDLVPGTESALNLCAPEIMQMTAELLSSNTWAVKLSGAELIGAMAKSQADYPSGVATSMIDRLLESLKGRTFDGKEALLLALQNVIISKNSKIRSCLELEKLEQVHEILVRETNKQKNIVYRIVAVTCMSHFAQQLEHESSANYLTETLIPILNKDTNLFEDEEDEKEGQKLILQFETVAFSALARTSFMKDKTHLDRVLSVCTARISNSYWKTQLAKVDCAKQIAKSGQPMSKHVVSEFLEKLCDLVEIVTNSTLGTGALLCVKEFALWALKTGATNGIPAWKRLSESTRIKEDSIVSNLIKQLL